MTTSEQAISEAFAAWAASRAYIDDRGNYHVRPAGRSSGPIAPWNRSIKRAFANVGAFHIAAMQQHPER